MAGRVPASGRLPYGSTVGHAENSNIAKLTRCNLWKRRPCGGGRASPTPPALPTGSRGLADLHVLLELRPQHWRGRLDHRTMSGLPSAFPRGPLPWTDIHAPQVAMMQDIVARSVYNKHAATTKPELVASARAAGPPDKVRVARRAPALSQAGLQPVAFGHRPCYHSCTSYDSYDSG